MYIIVLVFCLCSILFLNKKHKSHWLKVKDRTLRDSYTEFGKDFAELYDDEDSYSEFKFKYVYRVCFFISFIPYVNWVVVLLIIVAMLIIGFRYLYNNFIHKLF